jgi:hypothetical protein
MIKLKSLLTEDFNYYKNGRWVHYTDVDYMKPRSDDQTAGTGDPHAIYLFPEEATLHLGVSLLHFFSNKKNKIVVKIPSDLRVFDVAHLSDEMVKIFDLNPDILKNTESEYGLKGSLMRFHHAFWHSLRKKFFKNPSEFSKFIMDKGYDAVFDDIGMINGKDEKQLVVFDPSHLKVIGIYPNDLEK